jgi:hypothetical protein
METCRILMKRIFHGIVLCNYRLKHSETDVIEEVFCRSKTAAAKKFRAALQGSIRIILAIARCDDFTEGFLEKLTKTEHWTCFLQDLLLILLLQISLILNEVFYTNESYILCGI